MTIRESVDLHPSNPQPPTNLFEEEIDLLQYFRIFTDRWRELMMFAIGAALLAGLVLIAIRLLTIPLYESAARRNRSDQQRYYL